MRTLRERVAAATSAAADLGMRNLEPAVLNDAGNLILHLAPYPIVARIANLIPGADAGRLLEVLAREVRVAQHLSRRGVPAVAPLVDPSPGPHRVGDTWMTLWEYIPPASPTPLDSLCRAWESGRTSEGLRRS